MCTREQDQWLHGGSGRQGPADDRVHTRTSTTEAGPVPTTANAASHFGPISALTHVTVTVNPQHALARTDGWVLRAAGVVVRQHCWQHWHHIA